MDRQDFMNHDPPAWTSETRPVIHVHPIHTEEQYQESLKLIEKYWSHLGTETPEGEALEVLATLLDVYEKQHHPILPPTTEEARKFREEQCSRNPNRQAIVRTLIRSLEKDYNDHEDGRAFNSPVDESDGDYCIVTGLYFPREMSEMIVTYSDYGPVWMGLWLDTPLLLDEEGDGNTLFPRWLAEVLKEVSDMRISEENIHD